MKINTALNAATSVAAGIAAGSAYVLHQTDFLLPPRWAGPVKAAGMVAVAIAIILAKTAASWTDHPELAPAPAAPPAP